ncbi:MAG: hypothetical protein IJB41_02390 [Clostridia bacterium]|nr:hypothetical protein [Clostridia bacterium]
MKKLLSLVLVLILALGCMATATATEITDYRTYITTTGEMETWNILYSQNAGDLNYLTNAIDGLLTNDPKGNLVANAAKEWNSEDGGQTWTFILNEGMTWSNQAGEVKAEVVAEDWMTGLEWILNFYKNDAANTSMPISMIVGAEDYYTYTKGYGEDASAEEIAEFEAICEKYGLEKKVLTADEAKALKLEVFDKMVGCDAPDKYTVVYSCTDKFSYFPTLATYNCLYPLSGALIEEIGVEGYYSVTPETLWYSGPYICTTFVHANEKIFTQNPNYWNAENVSRFNSIIIKAVESSDVAFQYFQTGEIDAVTLSQSNLSSIYSNESNEFHDYLVEGRRDKYSYSIRFNYNKNQADGVTPDDNWNKAIANENFRQALRFGLDPVPYLERTNFINPLKCQNLAYTAHGVSTTTAGVDYVDLVQDEIGMHYNYEAYERFQPEVAAEYKAKAIEELTAEGVTFPVMIDYYISGSNQTSMDTATVWKQSISDTLGDDFVQLNICTYISSSTQEVRNPRKQSISISGWGADFGDPINFMGQETYGDDNAYYAVYWENLSGITDPELIEIYETFTAMVNEAAAITDDHDARLAAFAKAEAYYLNHALSIPWMYNITWSLTGVNDYSKPFAAYGIQSNRWVNWETKFELYTTEDYAAIIEEYNK